MITIGDLDNFLLDHWRGYSSVDSRVNLKIVRARDGQIDIGLAFPIDTSTCISYQCSLAGPAKKNRPH